MIWILHGLTTAEAEPRLNNFLRAAVGNGHSAVLIIHGKGLHNGGQRGVLKRFTHDLLKRHRAVQSILLGATKRRRPPARFMFYCDAKRSDKIMNIRAVGNRRFRSRRTADTPDAEPLVSGMEGLKTLQVIEAIQSSAASNAIVFI